MNRNSIRDTYKYHIKRKTKILHRGITNDLDRRHSEHKRRYGDDVSIKQIGKKVYRSSGLRWEREGGKQPKKRKTYKNSNYTLLGVTVLIFIGVCSLHLSTRA